MGLHSHSATFLITSCDIQWLQRHLCWDLRTKQVASQIPSASHLSTTDLDLWPVCVCVRHGQDVAGWRSSARFWTKYGNMFFHICWKSWQHKKRNSVLGWKPFRVYPGCSISRPPANRPTNHTNTQPCLCARDILYTSNLEIRHRLLNSVPAQHPWVTELPRKFHKWQPSSACGHAIGRWAKL